MPVILFGGMFMNNSNLGAWLSWVQYLSPIKYCAEALLWNEFNYDPYNVRDGLMTFLGYKLSYWKAVGILIGLSVIFRIIAFIFFKMLVKKFQ